MITASACAKTILFGEHAVVYGEPAIAVPLVNTRTTAELIPNEGTFLVVSDKIGLRAAFDELPKESGIRHLLLGIMEETGLSELPPLTLKISSDIPIASGLGSGAALSAAVIRAFARFYGREPDTETVNRMVYEIEKVYHGTPSGIDNTVIVYEQPVIFTKGSGFTPLEADLSAFPLLVADSGIRSRTVEVVSDVRNHFDRNEPYIRKIGDLVREAETALTGGDLSQTGRLMNENQKLLKQIDVSCPELDELITLAIKNGAYGAKLTGAGRGGNFIVLCKDPLHANSLKTLYKERGVHVIL
ncbi:MAG: mevalonate kinase [Flexilinea sp.]|nr:mevalonate kinase [Flexilinea sp.]